jgi:hypothetical protein
MKELNYLIGGIVAALLVLAGSMMLFYMVCTIIYIFFGIIFTVIFG